MRRRCFIRRDQSGVAIIEFALLLPVLAILVFGVIDLGRVYSVTDHLRNAAREGAYLAATQPYYQYAPSGGTTCTTPNDIWDRVVSESQSTTSSVSMTVTVVSGQYGTESFATTGADYPGSLVCSTKSVSNASVTVKVTDNTFSFLTPLATSVIGNVHPSATVTVQEIQ